MRSGTNDHVSKWVPKYVVIRCRHPYGFQDPYLIELVTVLVLRSSIKAKFSLECYH